MYFRRPTVDIAANLVKVEPCNEPAFAKAKRTKGPKRAGLIYQTAASEHLLSLFPSNSTFGQWFRYRLKDAPRDYYCQIDAHLVDYDKKKIVVIEIKLRHCVDAYYQLFELYLPILRKYYGEEFTYSCVELVSSFDKNAVMPQTPRLCKNIADSHPKDFSVHIWSMQKYMGTPQHKKSIPLEI